MAYTGVPIVGWEISKGNVTDYEVFQLHGFNDDIDAAEDVWNLGGDVTLLTSASLIQVVSASADDTAAGTGAQVVTVEGLNSSYEQISEELILNGTTSVDSTQSFLRLNRAYVSTVGSGGVNAGSITLRFVTGAVDCGLISAGEGQHGSAVYTIPADKTGYLVWVSVSHILASTAGFGIMQFQAREINESWMTKFRIGLHSLGANNIEMKPHCPLVLPEKTDLKFRHVPSAANAQAQVTANIVLINNRSLVDQRV